MADCSQKGVLERAPEEFEAEAAKADNNGVSIVLGDPYMTDAKGRLVPLDTVKPMDKLQDELVRKIVGYAEPLAAQVARFREHSFDDVDSFVGLVAQEYGAKPGGQKGNMTFTSFDGCLQVKVAIGDNITFGPELQAAKTLVDECLRDWTDGARSELRALIDRAFDVDKEGKINRGELLGLRRLDIKDERWVRAMQALNDSIKVIGSKRYVRCYRRDNGTAPWEPIVIDVAAS